MTAIYPGSFDPITNGHLDLIERGRCLFDQLIVAILRNETKQPLFSVEERIEMLREVVGCYANVAVDSFDGLLVDYAAAMAPPCCCAAYAPFRITNMSCRWP